MNASRLVLMASTVLFLIGVSAPVVLGDPVDEARCDRCAANQCSAVALVGGPCNTTTHSCCCCTIPAGGYTCTCETISHCLNTSGCYEGAGT